MGMLIDNVESVRASASPTDPVKRLNSLQGDLVRWKMKRALGRTAMSLVVANGLFGLSGCGGSDGSSTAIPSPAPPPAPAPAPPPAAAYSATVSWSMPMLNTDGTSLSDVSGYRIHYGTSPASLTLSVLVSGAGVTSRVISGLTPGTYYFAVSTVNSVGTASDLSNPASKTVP